MKTSLFTALLAGAALLAACQASPDTAAPEPSTSGPAVQSPLLTRYNLAPLLQHAHQPEGDTSNQACQGFFGPTHRRIELVFTQVRSDPARPATYAVRGQIRYRGIITSFAGAIVFAQAVEQPRFVSQPETAADDGEFFYPGTGITCNDCAMYTAIGNSPFAKPSIPATTAPTAAGSRSTSWSRPPAGRSASSTVSLVR